MDGLNGAMEQCSMDGEYGPHCCWRLGWEYTDTSTEEWEAPASDRGPKEKNNISVETKRIQRMRLLAIRNDSSYDRWHRSPVSDAPEPQLNNSLASSAREIIHFFPSFNLAFPPLSLPILPSLLFLPV